MKEIKRVLSLILCFVMVVGMMPVFVLNAEAATGALVDTAVIFSDLHIGTNDTDKEALLQGVLNAIVGNGYSVSSVNSAGDMFSSNTATMEGSVSTVTVVSAAAVSCTTVSGTVVSGTVVSGTVVSGSVSSVSVSAGLMVKGISTVPV